MTASPPPSRWRPNFDRKGPKVWDPEKARTINTYPKTPEAYAAMRAAQRDRMTRLHAEGRATRRGVPDGWAGRKAEVTALRERSAKVADVVVGVLRERGELDADEDPRAAEALACLVGILGDPSAPTSYRTTAARVLLEFLQPKPTTRRAATIADAESLLASLCGDLL